jgi:hypothetical protein
MATRSQGLFSPQSSKITKTSIFHEKSWKTMIFDDIRFTLFLNRNKADEMNPRCFSDSQYSKI